MWTKNRNGIIDRALHMAKIVTVGNPSPLYWVNEAADQLQSIIESLNNEGFDVLKTRWTKYNFQASSQVTAASGTIYTCREGHTSTAEDEPEVGANFMSYWYPQGTIGGTWSLGTKYNAIGDFDLNDDTLEVVNAFIRQPDGTDDNPLSIINEDEYMGIEDKYSFGLPYYMYINYNTDNFIPHAYLYYQPDVTTYILNCLEVRKMEACDTAASTPEIQKRFYNYIIHQLAYDLSKIGGLLNETAKSRLQADAAKLFYEAKKFHFYQSNGGNVSYPSFSNYGYNYVKGIR